MTLEEFELLSQLTIVIPTANRPLALERSIEYWRDLPVTVHILDGSDKPWFSDGLLSGTQKIFYYHMPPELNQNPMVNYSFRVLMGLDFFQTDFSAFLTDDDFFTVDAMCKALTILNSEQLIDAVIGRCATYQLSDGQVVWRKKYSGWTSNLNLSSSEISKRLENDPAKYILYYGVLRTQKLVFIHKQANKYVFSDFRINELLAHHLGLAACRVRLIEDYLWLREKSSNKNPNYMYQIRSNDAFDKSHLEEIFKESFFLIEPSMNHEALSGLTATRVREIFSRLEYLDCPRPVKQENTLRRLETWVKSKIVFLIAILPSIFTRLFLLPLSSSQKTGVVNSLPPCFPERDSFNVLLLMPREELRLRANI